MKAIFVKENQRLSIENTADPTLEKGHVLIEVHACGVNRADLMQRAGYYPPPAGASNIMGLEISGVVIHVSNDVDKSWIGKRVCALLPGGGYAELASVPVELLFQIPNYWSFTYAAAIPEVFLTAYTNLFLEGNLQAGETVLIHGGASGVGTASIQLAKASGATVYTTVGNDEKVSRCKELGATLAINYKEKDFVSEIKNHREGKGVDLVIDIIGKDYFARNIDVLQSKGRMVALSSMSGKEAQLDLGKLMSKRLKIIGSVLRSRSLEEKIEIVTGFKKLWWPRLISGEIAPVIDQVLPWEEVERAHQGMSGEGHFGKIVLEVS